MHSSARLAYGVRTKQDRLFNIMPQSTNSGTRQLQAHQHPQHDHSALGNGANGGHLSSDLADSQPMRTTWYRQAAFPATSRLQTDRQAAAATAAEQVELSVQHGFGSQQGAAFQLSYPPPEKPTPTPVADRKVALSDEAKSFLAKPVSGPFRPIYFDLETTGDLLTSESFAAAQHLRRSDALWLCCMPASDLTRPIVMLITGFAVVCLHSKVLLRCGRETTSLCISTPNTF